jgi:hypothetical protein
MLMHVVRFTRFVRSSFFDTHIIVTTLLRILISMIMNSWLQKLVRFGRRNRGTYIGSIPTLRRSLLRLRENRSKI